jgi:hypothetical protein
LLAIAGTAATLGAIHTQAREVTPESIWLKDLALVGLGFGALLGLLLPSSFWQGGRWLVAIAVGSGTCGLAYMIASAVVYGGGDESDTGGLGLVFVVFMVVCAGPMVTGAAVGGLVHTAVARVRARWRGAPEG